MIQGFAIEDCHALRHCAMKSVCPRTLQITILYETDSEVPFEWILLSLPYRWRDITLYSDGWNDSSRGLFDTYGMQVRLLYFFKLVLMVGICSAFDTRGNEGINDVMLKENVRDNNRKRSERGSRHKRPPVITNFVVSELLERDG